MVLPHQTQPFPSFDFPLRSNAAEDAPLPFRQHNSTSWTPTDSVTPISTNPSRKRSRDETSFREEVIATSYFPSQQVNTPASIPEEEPIYGEGMTLLNPRPGMAVSADSQTGTWYEEKAEVESRHATEAARPVMPKRKSVRMGSTTSLPRLDDISAAAGPPTEEKAAPEEPQIDDFTIALGIGWTRISGEDPDIQAAARGWAKFLENEYDEVHSAQVLAKSKGLNTYLVGCQEGFYLFSDDLKEGRLLGSDWENTKRNLMSVPPRFEGNVVLKAGGSQAQRITSQTNGVGMEID